jgi:site-specific recombinase XerD
MSGSRRKPRPLGPFVDGYRARLLEPGYSPPSTTRSLIALGHLGRWMDREALDVNQLSGEVVKRFLVAHVREDGQLPSAGLLPLMEYLRSEGVVAPEPVRQRTALDHLLAEYRDWLAVERALAPETVRGYARLAGRFLAERVTGEDEFGVQGLTGADVNGFLLRESTRVRAGSVCCHANRLRQLLRYLAMRGLADPGVATAVPPVGRWRDASVPQFPPRPAIDRLLASCDRSRRVGVRDYAILMLLARLGLRTVEVARLELDDLYWRIGEIEVDGKGHERARLPLAVDVGEALVDYLRLRGSHGTRRVFLTEHAPTRPIESPGVRSVVRDACRRAGIERVGAHRLRHALASQLLGQGASLIDVSQVLRHKQLESTAIYAKVDLDTAAADSRALAGSGTMTTFTQHVEDYLRLRRTLGYKLHDHARLLRRFAARLDTIGDEFVTIEFALAWALEPEVPPGSAVPWMRLLVARGFARYMAGIDPRTEIPPTGLIRFRQRRRPPFIYCDTEIEALMQQARTSIRQALCAATYETLIGLLAATGMRSSEAIKLDRTDVDLAEGVLLVRESKFGICRNRHMPNYVAPRTMLRCFARLRCLAGGVLLGST